MLPARVEVGSKAPGSDVRSYQLPELAGVSSKTFDSDSGFVAWME